MENSVKALYIAAGMLLGVMILSVWGYLFRQGASLGKNYEFDRLTEQIQAFNSQFEKYANTTIQRGSSYGYSFEQKGNIPSEVITCANLAYNINRKNEYDGANCVEVSVKVNGGTTYYVHSAISQPKNYFLINISKASARSATFFDTNNTSKCKSFYDFMKTYNNIKIVNISAGIYSTSAETVYEYYFDVNPDGIHYNEDTGKIDEIIFTAVPTNQFTTNGAGNWSENL